MIEIRDMEGTIDPLEPRQGLGAAQYDGNTILLLGGFGGKYF